MVNIWWIFQWRKSSSSALEKFKQERIRKKSSFCRPKSKHRNTIHSNWHKHLHMVLSWNVSQLWRTWHFRRFLAFQPIAAPHQNNYQYATLPSAEYPRLSSVAIVLAVKWTQHKTNVFNCILTLKQISQRKKKCSSYLCFCAKMTWIRKPIPLLTNIFWLYKSQ